MSDVILAGVEKVFQVTNVVEVPVHVAVGKTDSERAFRPGIQGLGYVHDIGPIGLFVEKIFYAFSSEMMMPFRKSIA